MENTEKHSNKGTEERRRKAKKGDESEDRPKKKLKKEEEEADANTKGQATQRETGEETRVSCSFPRRVLETPVKRTRGLTHQHHKDEARKGGKRKRVRGTKTLRNQHKRN